MTSIAQVKQHSRRALRWATGASALIAVVIHFYLQLEYVTANGGFMHGPPTESIVRNWHFLFRPFVTVDKLVVGMVFNALLVGCLVGILVHVLLRRLWARRTA